MHANAKIVCKETTHLPSPRGDSASGARHLTTRKIYLILSTLYIINWLTSRHDSIPTLHYGQRTLQGTGLFILSVYSAFFLNNILLLLFLFSIVYLKIENLYKKLNLQFFFYFFFYFIAVINSRYDQTPSRLEGATGEACSDRGYYGRSTNSKYNLVVVVVVVVI